MRAWVELGLYTKGSSLCGPGDLCSKMILVFGVRPAGIAQNPGPRGPGPDPALALGRLFLLLLDMDGGQCSVI
jgi:hypothetical protein